MYTQVTIVILTLAKVLLAFQLENKKFYVIQNAMDKTYLKAINNGDLCKRRGDVISSSHLDNDSAAYRWMFRTSHTTEGAAYLSAASKEFRNNELTMEDVPPYCYLQFAEYKLTQAEENSFSIENIKTNMCLTISRGEEKISWEECKGASRNDKNQLWTFIDLNKQMLLQAKRGSIFNQ